LLFFFIEPFAEQEKGEPTKTASFREKLPNIPNISIPSLPKLQRPNLSLPAIPRIKSPQITLPKVTVSIPEKLKNVAPIKKAAGLLFVLALILGIGFAIFKGSSFSTASVEAEAVLKSAEILQFRAQQALVLQNEKEANRLFQEAWEKIEPYAGSEEFQSIHGEIEVQLQKLNKIEFIETPDVFVSINTANIPEAPQKVLAIQGTLYLFHPFSSEIIAVEISSKSEALLSPGRNLRFGDNFGSTFLFFADPNILVSFNETSGWQEHQISLAEDFHVQGMASFGQSIYLFDGSAGEIGKVALSQPAVESWVGAASLKKPLDAASIAVDGNIWVLKKNGEIQRYFKGQYEESIAVQVFPRLQNPTKIYTRAQLPYLYILDPENARILVLSKFGDVIRQYQSPEFNGATDFVVSVEGNTMYILVGEKVYRIQDMLAEL